MPEDPTQAAHLARHLVREAMTGALGTLGQRGGGPYVSRVTVATLPDGAPVFLMSRLSPHTRNLEADPRAALLLTSGAPREAETDLLDVPRVTVEGTVRRLEDQGPARRRFLARHPSAALYADFGDFGFFGMTAERAHLVVGFARTANIGSADLVSPSDSAGLLADVEADAIAHMNADHADALSLYAERLANAGPGAWRATGCDPDGLDLALGERGVRIDFPERVTSAAELRAMLVRLAHEAHGHEGETRRA